MRRLLVLALPLLVIGCDSPGGGGGGGVVDCSVTPNLPVCRPDTGSTDVTDTSTSGDTTDPDTNVGPGDTTQLDTNIGPDDTTQPDTQVQPDTVQPDTITPECSGSAFRCNGDEVQACSGGFWVTTQVCTDTNTCRDGTCIPSSTCTNGSRRCSGSNIEQCTLGQWAFAQACSNGCTNEACNPPPTSGLVCDDVFTCIVDAGCFDAWPTPPTSTCTSPCLNQGTTTGRNEMNAVLSCYATCNYDDACVVDTCYQQRANCFFDTTGSLSCPQIDQCIGDCTSGGPCVIGCYESGTNPAQGAYLRVTECIDAYCQQDEACISEVITPGGPCAQAFETCFGP